MWGTSTYPNGLHKDFSLFTKLTNRILKEKDFDLSKELDQLPDPSYKFAHLALAKELAHVGKCNQIVWLSFGGDYEIYDFITTVLRVFSEEALESCESVIADLLSQLEE